MHRTRVATCLLAAALIATLTAPAATGALNLDLSAPELQWRKIAPLPVPSWFTPELHRAAVAAGPQGVALPAGAEAPVSSLAFLGIRPGQLVIITSKDGSTISLCTSNFLFGGGSQHYIGMAGHCGEVGDSVDMVFLPNVLTNIGTVSMSTGDAGVGNDFALIRINPALNSWTSPSMAYWGGPTGAYTGSGPAVIAHAGWGLVVGTGGTPRLGLGVEWTPEEWLFEAVITPGDSGSGATVLPGGLAAGNITHIAVRPNSLTIAAGTSIERILELAGQPLETCPSAIPWPLPGCPG